MPFVRSELRMSYLITGLHFTAFAFGGIVSGSISERITFKFGRKFTFWGSGILVTIGILLFTLARYPLITIMSTIIMGFSGCLLLVNIQAILSDRHGDHRAIALTEANVSASLFAVLSTVAIGVTQRADLGWRSALYTGIVLFLLTFSSSFKEPLPAPSSLEKKGIDKAGKLPRIFWVFALVIFLSVSIEWCITYWGAEFLNVGIGLQESAAATLMSAFFIAMLLGRILGSRLTRSFQSRRLLIIAISIVVVGFPIFWLSPLPALNVAGLFVMGLGVANLWPLTISSALSIVPHLADVASARLILIASFATGVVPLTLGWVADQTGIRNAYSMVGIFALVAAAMIVFANYLVSASSRSEMATE